LGKASLALVFAVIVVVVLAPVGRQVMAQISTATVDQYLTQVGEDASTTSQSFRESRSRGPEALATRDEISSDTSGNFVNAPSASKSGATGDTAAASPGASADAPAGDKEAGGRQAANLSSLPETGGPGAATLLWGVIALVSLLPCLKITHTAATSARDPG
jgi:hypothetical protein